MRNNLEAILLGPAFGRTDFSRIFNFEPPDFVADFLAGFFLLIFVGKSAQKNPPGKSPRKSSKIYTTKILQHISADWPGQILLFVFYCSPSSGRKKKKHTDIKKDPQFRGHPKIFMWGLFPWKRKEKSPPPPQKQLGPSNLSGPLNRSNSMLSLLHPLDSYRTPSE